MLLSLYPAVYASVPPGGLSVTESELFTLLGNFFQGIVDSTEIIRGQNNRTPTPSASDYIVMTQSWVKQLAVPSNFYSGNTVSISQPREWAVSVDCFGPRSCDIAGALSMVIKTPYACDQLLPVLAPLYADDAKQFPLIDGEQQYEDRWRFDAVLQYTPVLVLRQESANTLALDVVSVDASYPPVEV